jgi:hypothetical protein
VEISKGYDLAFAIDVLICPSCFCFFLWGGGRLIGMGGGGLEATYQIQIFHQMILDNLDSIYIIMFSNGQNDHEQLPCITSSLAWPAHFS